jgi:hypothetical protein
MELGFGVGTLSLSGIFAMLAIASIVIFIVYAAEWNSHDTSSGENNVNIYEDRVRTQFGYYASVISLLVILAGLHGYALARELL